MQQTRAGGGYAADSTTRLGHVEQRAGDSRGAQGLTRRASNDVRKATAIAAATIVRASTLESPFDAKPRPRAHEPIDLTAFLVERRPAAAERDQETQTDALAELPPPAPYAPAKTGVDAGTQITHGDRHRRSTAAAVAGACARRAALVAVSRLHALPARLLPPSLRSPEHRLFDFDAAIAPLVTVLADKVLETALSEVVRERSIRALRGRREAATAALSAERDAEAAIARRAAAAVVSTQALLAQGRARLAAEQECQRKVRRLS